MSQKTLLKILAFIVCMALLAGACTKDAGGISNTCTTYQLIKDWYTLDSVFVKTISKKDYQACNDADKLKFETMPIQWHRICDDVVHLEHWYYVKSKN